jgi:ribose-phosphate pyrophosphokinase
LPRFPRAWLHCTPVLVDDIASTGHTLLAAARALREAPAAAPVCVVVHALFDEQTASKLLLAGVVRIASCDTVRHPSNAIALGPALARAVRSLT